MTSAAQFPDEQNASGEFVRQADAFRDWISSDGSTLYPAAKGRYHLYISLACPWACRTFIVRKLKGLERVIGVTVVDPIRDERGWAFRQGPGHSLDPVNSFSFLSEAYTATDPQYRGRVTVPVLWDKQTRRIVSNSEDDICRMFNNVFSAFSVVSEFAGGRDAPPARPLDSRRGRAGGSPLPGNSSPNEGIIDLFPPEIEAEHRQLATFVYENINNGVYRAGFADTQPAYAKACRALFAALDKLEKKLSHRRYLFGKRIVEVDWRLFCTLVRFDAVYHGHFKCNVRRIVDYPNLQGYLQDLYQQPGITATVNFDHIKRHYYYTHADINPTRIVPIGPALDLTRPHGRSRLT